MRLLFDENLSSRLAKDLATEHPGSAHVSDLGFRGMSDHRIWEYARTNGFVVVSKDTDFRERSFVEGFPPKVIWLDVGNAGTARIAALFRSERNRIERFELSEDSSLLVLSILKPAGDVSESA